MSDATVTRLSVTKDRAKALGQWVEELSHDPVRTELFKLGFTPFQFHYTAFDGSMLSVSPDYAEEPVWHVCWDENEGDGGIFVRVHTDELVDFLAVRIKEMESSRK